MTQLAHGGPAALVSRNAADPDAVFVVALAEDKPARTVTYAEQWSRVLRTAAALRAHGVRSGDRVLLQTENRLEFFDIWFATDLLGACLVPVGPQSAPAELRHVVEDCRPRLCISPHGSLLPDTVPTVSPDAMAAWAARTAADETGDEEAGPPAEAGPASILYTSGTTSRPKGVLVTRANYVAVGQAVAAHLAMTAADRWLVALPLYHANAQYYCTMSALVTGASIVLAPRFSASRWTEQAAANSATLGSLFAAPIRMVLAHPATVRPDSLRAVIFAQNLTDAQAEAFEDRCGTRLVQLYGMTETVLPATINPVSQERRWSSIGRATTGVALRIVDRDGHVVPESGVGELQVRGQMGHTVAAGYYGQPEATAATFGDGWLRTGDLARRDVDGYYYFVDRAKDMIKRAGENIAASEIERVLAAHPGVADCAVVGVPDPVRDESIVAWVVAASTPPVPAVDLATWSRQHLAEFKVPERFLFVDSLPRTSVGKIRKGELRESAHL